MEENRNMNQETQELEGMNLPEVPAEAAIQPEEPYKSGSVQYIDSREVAKMIEKDHRKLLRDIRRYNAQLDTANFGDISMFWTESTYADIYGRTQKCYLVTEKGCEFIAHKLTGQKGSLFTATYINRFHAMKDALAGDTDAMADVLKEYMTSQDKHIRKMEEAIISVASGQMEFQKSQAEFNRSQTEFNQKVMEAIMNLSQPRGAFKDSSGYSPWDMGESERKERMKSLNSLVDQVAAAYGLARNRTLHYMYQTMENRMGISLNPYLQVYQNEVDEDACMLHVIAANDRMYKMAVEMSKEAIERKRAFG